MTVGTKQMYLANLANFLKHFDYKKPFKAMTSAALTSLRKDRSQDPDQHFVNTYNQCAIVISKFYKWLVFPEKMPGERRNKITKEPLPEVLKDLIYITKKGSKSPVKSTVIRHE